MSEKKFYGEIQKNSLERIRISLNEFKETEYIDIRLWWSKDGQEGTFSPGKKGITIKFDLLKEFRTILNRAFTELIEE